MVSLSERYRPRHIRFLELWQDGGWTMKVYGISVEPAGPPSGLRRAARHFMARSLPAPPVTSERYGVGFVGIHAGRDANLVFVDWWGRENELHHQVAVSALDRPERLRPVASGELSACVWDVAVICFERDAWVETVLAAREPSLNRYLERRLETIA